MRSTVAVLLKDSPIYRRPSATMKLWSIPNINSSSATSISFLLLFFTFNINLKLQLITKFSYTGISRGYSCILLISDKGHQIYKKYSISHRLPEANADSPIDYRDNTTSIKFAPSVLKPPLFSQPHSNKLAFINRAKTHKKLENSSYEQNHLILKQKFNTLKW